jgi:hypothetical protein
MLLGYVVLGVSGLSQAGVAMGYESQSSTELDL